MNRNWEEQAKKCLIVFFFRHKKGYLDYKISTINCHSVRIIGYALQYKHTTYNHPTVRGPIIRFSEAVNWAPVNRAPFIVLNSQMAIFGKQKFTYNCLQFWPTSGANYITYKFVHWMAPVACNHFQLFQR